MKNLKIFIKLMFAFGSILLATFILGITALVSIQSLNKISSNFVEVSVPSVSYLWTARRAIQATEKMALETTVVMTEEELKEFKAKYRDAKSWAHGFEMDFKRSTRQLEAYKKNLELLEQVGWHYGRSV